MSSLSKIINTLISTEFYVSLIVTPSKSINEMEVLALKTCQIR